MATPVLLRRPPGGMMPAAAASTCASISACVTDDGLMVVGVTRLPASELHTDALLMRGLEEVASSGTTLGGRNVFSLLPVSVGCCCCCGAPEPAWSPLRCASLRASATADGVTAGAPWPLPLEGLNKPGGVLLSLPGVAGGAAEGGGAHGRKKPVPALGPLGPG